MSSYVQAGHHSAAVTARIAQLTLNMVDMRCPSQFEKCFSMEKGALLGQGRGRRHLLDEIDFEAVDEPMEEVTDGTRHLLQAGKPAKMTLRAFRELSRAGAIAKAHEYCNGAPDDRGPAVFFPLHLDIEVDNTPLEIAQSASTPAIPGLPGVGGGADAAGAAAEAAPGK